MNNVDAMTGNLCKPGKSDLGIVYGQSDFFSAEDIFGVESFDVVDSDFIPGLNPYSPVESLKKLYKSGELPHNGEEYRYTWPLSLAYLLPEFLPEEELKKLTLKPKQYKDHVQDLLDNYITKERFCPSVRQMKEFIANEDTPADYSLYVTQDRSGFTYGYKSYAEYLVDGIAGLDEIFVQNGIAKEVSDTRFEHNFGKFDYTVEMDIWYSFNGPVADGTFPKLGLWFCPEGKILTNNIEYAKLIDEKIRKLYKKRYHSEVDVDYEYDAFGEPHEHTDRYLYY